MTVDNISVEEPSVIIISQSGIVSFDNNSWPIMRVSYAKIEVIIKPLLVIMLARINNAEYH